MNRLENKNGKLEDKVHMSEKSNEKMQRIIEYQQGWVGNMGKWMSCNNIPVIGILRCTKVST